MCFQTYQRFLSKNLKKSLWSAEEDEVLRELVDKMRIGNFIPYTQSESPAPSLILTIDTFSVYMFV